jgi:hypothetical protein
MGVRIRRYKIYMKEGLGTAETKFFVGYSLYDYKTNEQIRKQLNIYSLNDNIVDYRHQWTRHLLIMNDTPIPHVSV